MCVSKPVAVELRCHATALIISSISLVHMNVFAKFDEIPSMILKVIKETKRYGHTVGPTVGRSVGQRENSILSHKHSLRTPANCVCGRVYCFHVRPSVCPSVRP